MSNMSNFMLALEEFTVQATGLSAKEAAGLASIYFTDEFELAYALQQYNPERYSSMTQAEILNDVELQMIKGTQEMTYTDGATITHYTLELDGVKVSSKTDDYERLERVLLEELEIQKEAA